MTTNRAKEILVDSVSQLLNSEQYKAALSFRKNFQHAYSFRNLWLIFAQYPEASMVAVISKMASSWTASPQRGAQHCDSSPYHPEERRNQERGGHWLSFGQCL